MASPSEALAKLLVRAATMSALSTELVGAVDQGTSSSRFLVSIGRLTTRVMITLMMVVVVVRVTVMVKL